MIASSPPSSGSISTRPGFGFADVDAAGASSVGACAGDALFVTGGNTAPGSSMAGNSPVGSSSISEPGMCHFVFESSQFRYREYVHIP